jgi:hypothetical protein
MCAILCRVHCAAAPCGIGPVRLVLLNEVLEDADVVASLASLSVHSAGGGSFGAQNGVHVGVLHAGTT